MRLVAVETAQSGGRRPRHVRRRQAFAAVFEASAHAAPASGETYWLAHRSAAPLPIHFATKSEAAGKARLVAIFN
jgi:hypothetical protein